MESPFTLFITTDPVETHREFNHDLDTGITGFFPLSLYRISGNEQSRWNPHFIRYGAKIQKIVPITIVESQHNCWNANLPRAQEANGLGKACNAVVFLQKKNLLQEHFCGHSHPMRAIRY